MGSANPELDTLNDILESLKSENVEVVGGAEPINNSESVNTSISTNNFEPPRNENGRNINVNELRTITDTLKKELVSNTSSGSVQEKQKEKEKEVEKVPEPVVVLKEPEKEDETLTNIVDLEEAKPIINTLESELQTIEAPVAAKPKGPNLDEYKVPPKNSPPVVAKKPVLNVELDESFPGDRNLGPILNLLDEYIAITPEDQVLRGQSDYNTLNNGNCWIELPKFYGVSTTPRIQFYEHLKLLQKFFGIWHKPYFFSKGPRPQILEDPMCYPENEETKTFIVKIFKTRIKTLNDQIKNMEGSGIQSDNLILKQRKIQIHKINVFLKSLEEVNSSAKVCEPILQDTGAKKEVEAPCVGCNCMKEMKQLVDLILLTMSLVAEPDQKAVQERMKELKISQLVDNPSISIEELHTLELAIRDIISTISKNPENLKKQPSNEIKKAVAPFLKKQGIAVSSLSNTQELLQDINAATSNIVKTQSKKVGGEINARSAALKEQTAILTNRKNALKEAIDASQEDSNISLSDDEKKHVNELLKIHNELEKVSSFMNISDDVRSTLKKYLDANEAIVEGKKLSSPLSEDDIGKIQTLLKQDVSLKFTVTIKELDKELIQELINKHEKALTDVGDEDFKATLSDEELDELRELLRVAEELDTIDLVLPLNEDDFNKLKKFMETNSKLGVGSGSGSGGFSDLKKLVSGEDETKLREFILANSKLQELKMYRPLLDSETVNKLKDLVEKKSNGSSGNLEEELNLISKQEEAIEKELLNTPMIREDSYSSDNTKDSSKLIENIKNNIQILNSNMNPFNDVLTLLSIDTNLRNKIKNYLENPTDEGLLSMKESIAEDEQAAEDVVNYLRIFLGYELHALDDESIPINVRLDVLSVFDFGTFVRNPEKEFSEILGLLEEFMLNRSTMDDYVSMLDTKLVGNREPIDFALSDSYKYLAGLVNSRIKNASSPYTGFQGDDIIPEQFIDFMEDKKTIFYHICLYNVGENISLKRIDDSFALEKTWKEGSMIPLNFFIVRFLQLLKSKFES